MKKELWLLFSTFFKIGAFTFGGGYAMLPLISKEAVDKYGWTSEEEMLEIVAIAEATPGPIAINSATFIGNKVAGIAGAMCATMGVVLPAFTIISIIAVLLSNSYELAIINYAFFGIRAGVLAILFKALKNMFKKSPKGIIPYIIMIGAFISVGIFKLNAFITLIVCALVGLVAFLVNNKEVQQ